MSVPEPRRPRPPAGQGAWTGTSVDRVRVQVFGPMEVRLHDEPVPLGGPKQRQVLACLIAARTQTVRVDALAEDLWGDEPPTTAVHVISTYVSGLRKVLGDRITSDSGGHALPTLAGR